VGRAAAVDARRAAHIIAAHEDLCPRKNSSKCRAP
jgi:hypothetical protein